MTVSIDNFEKCAEVVELLDQGNETKARDEVIKILASANVDEEFGELLNNLIRRLGLLPYIQARSASWQDRFAQEAFKVDIGSEIPATLHREQSKILKRLLDGESLAVSAPTSFGKSFIIDAFIATRRPLVVVIIVPTIALADETRRRLQRKFGGGYKIITTAGVELAEHSILIFPAERAIGYVQVLRNIDLLIVDEFYKADIHFDKDRSPSLLRAIMRLSPRANQRYFLAPNIKKLDPNAFTKGMDFVALDFRTVFLKIEHAYRHFGPKNEGKTDYLLKVLRNSNEKTLIYAGAHSTVNSIGLELIEAIPKNKSVLLNSFAKWLETNYGTTWQLPELVRRGIGIHTGRLHRFLGQVQINLFERDDEFKTIISTSSIIEGVNTQAKNVVIWKSKNGNSSLTDFTYKNIVGRGGRAFRHFVGNIYLLDKPPPVEESSLTLEMPDDVLVGEPQMARYDRLVSRDQVARILAQKEEMRLLIGAASYDEAIASGRFVTTDRELLRNIAGSVKALKWNGIGYLNSANSDRWGYFLHTAMNLQPAGWDGTHTNAVNFVKVLNHNWVRTIPELVSMLGGRLSLDGFFSLERLVTFKLASILTDVNTINRMVNNSVDDISPFLSRIRCAFLPPVVHDLEEYGLPRMISRKLHDAKFIRFDNPNLTLHTALDQFRNSGIHGIASVTNKLTKFDLFLLEYFLEGIKFRRHA